MGRTGQKNEMPDLPISAMEIEVIKMARASLPRAMKRLIQLAQSRSESQSRQAIELLFKYGLADRQQQFDIQGHEMGSIEGGGGHIHLTLNKFELQLNELMKTLSPDLRVEFANIIEKMQNQADDLNFDVVEGLVIEEPTFKTCECGCGEKVNKGRRFVHGHHMRRHMTHNRIAPPEIKRLKETGEWEEARKTIGPDKRKAATMKKELAKKKREERRQRELDKQENSLDIEHLVAANEE